MKKYVLYIRYWFGLRVKIIRTNNIYEYVGKFYLSSMQQIKRIDYGEIKNDKQIDSIIEYFKENGVEVCIEL